MSAMTTDILPGLIEILDKLQEGEQPIGAQTDIVADLGLDSPQVMDLVLEIEDRFDVSVRLNVLPEVHTVGDLAEQVARLRGEGQ